jgi:hypothetical protein
MYLHVQIIPPQTHTNTDTCNFNIKINMKSHHMVMHNMLYTCVATCMNRIHVHVCMYVDHII